MISAISATYVCSFLTLMLQKWVVHSILISPSPYFPDLQQFDSKSLKSQWGQDKWLYKNIFGPLGLADTSRHYFVEVGAGDGIKRSNTYFFEKELGWQGVLIEAGRDDTGMLPQNRVCKLEGFRVDACLHAAVSDVEGESFVFEGEGETGRQRYTHKAGTPAKSTTHKKGTHVYSTTLNAIVRTYRLPRIDFLSVECEGCELTALKAFDFNIPVGTILVEKSPDDNYACEIKAFLTSKGFMNIRIPGPDEAFVSKAVAAAIPKPDMLPAGEGCVKGYTWDNWPTK